ncbi:Mg2+ transporter -like Zinc transport protein [Rutstroemia sp. NJR-2017a BVV2]|nr:Mg2+ transporter -like Zinc transport protein [Rutstroemia sp. NJR-2017a BVV2]
MSPPKQRLLSAFPTIVEDAEDSPTPDSSLRRSSSRTPFVEIWPRDNAPTEIVRGKLLEDKINSWIEQKDEFAYAKRESSKFGALRLLLTNRSLDQNRKAGMTFSDLTLQLISSRLKFPPAFTKMLAPDQIEPPRFSHNTLFDSAGNHSGMSLALHFPRQRLESLTLGVTYSHPSRVVTALLIENTSTPTPDSFINYILSQASYLTHPLYLPLLCTEITLDVHRAQVDRTVLRLRSLESVVGVHDFDSGGEKASYGPSHNPKGPLPDLEYVTRSLSGENTRLALYETKVASSVQLLRMILRAGYFTSPGNATGAIGVGSRLAWMDVANVVLREKAEFLLGWNVDLLARVNGQRRIGKGLRESVRTILAQRENRTSTSMWESKKSDSNAIRSIAVVLVSFLPGAFIAILFSTTMFNFQTRHRDGLVSEWFWLYWAITGPLTAAVLMVWIWWVRPWL